MNILYLGKFFPEKLLKTVSKDNKCKIGFSNHNFEKSILNGLCQQDEIDLKCATLPGVFSFPHNNKKLFTFSEHYAYRNAEIYSAGFCNIAILKELWSTLSCTMIILKYAKSFKGDTIHTIINTPDRRLLEALKIARLFSYKHFTQTIIIPDIPSMVTAMDKQNPVKKALLRHNNRMVMKSTSNSDGLVLLSEAMMDFIEHPVKHIIMEGIVDTATMDVHITNINTDKKIVLYTGTLRKIFGVMNLVNAFGKISDPNVELWICGSGDARNEILEAAQKDSRIKFWGLVDSKKALIMQHQATILINPRTSEGEFTKYSFPSKTMEYLLSGKSVIINRLPGIPEEYYKYVYTPEDESIDSLANCISHVLSIDSDTRQKFASAGRQFIMEKKNSKIQVSRILEMIKTYSA